MAGGRRPANFAVTGKHQRAADSAPTPLDGYSIWQHPRAASPPRVPAAVPYYHLPSGAGLPAEQPPPADAPSPPGASALASALDSAVVAAVTRALASGAAAKSPAPLPGDDRASALSFNHVVGGSSRASSVSAGADLSTVVELQVESEAQERRRDVASLHAAVARLEARADEAAEEARRDRACVGDLEARVNKAEEEARRASAAREAMRTSLRGAQRAAEGARAEKKKAEAEVDRLRAEVAKLAKAVAAAERQRGRERDLELEREVEREREREREKEKERERERKRERERERERARESKERGASGADAVAAAAAVKAAKEAADSVSGVRSRVKKLESAAEASVRRSEKMSTELALQAGAIEQLRSNGSGALVAQVAGLKKLVEANLRSHASSEGVVQSQAQLITRHVCVALREFIARRISTRITENNVLIDRTLRARVPAYAEGSDEFVLVRETELADLRSAETSPLAAAAAGAADGAQETSSIVPRQVVDSLLDSKTPSRVSAAE